MRGVRGVRHYGVQCMREHCRFITVNNLPPLEECVVELCGVVVLLYSDL